jgi:hypothetical protein
MKFPLRVPGSSVPQVLHPVSEPTLSSLIVELANRTTAGAGLVLNDDFTAVQSDPHMRWVSRQYSTEFPKLIKLLVGHGLAEREPLGASDGGNKIKVRPNFAWWDLVMALDDPNSFRQSQPFIAEARHTINK